MAKNDLQTDDGGDGAGPGPDAEARGRSRSRTRTLAALGALLAALAAVSVIGASTLFDDDEPIHAVEPSLTWPSGDPYVAVAGNELVDAEGAPIRLVGVNRSGAEYACVQGWGIFDGAADAALVENIAAWGVNSVRVTLNEHCWLGINGVAEELGGENYRRAIIDFVDLLHQQGFIVILALQWSAGGTDPALSQPVQASADHAPDFWRSVAETFELDRGVIFDLYSEPHRIDWACWRDGCTTGDGYRAAGMQELVDAVRSTGARHPLILSGLTWANDLSEWREHLPVDPENALVAGFHLYNFNRCITPACWKETVESIARDYPVVTAELGEDTCDSAFIEQFMDWSDARGMSYLAWTWNAWDSCELGPALVVDESGTPTGFGEGFRDHVLGLRDDA